MKTIGQLNQKHGRFSLLAFNGSELRSTTGNLPASAPVMASAAQVFGHGVLTHAASSARKRVMLPKDQVWRIEGTEAPGSIRIIKGALWITVDGDQRDHVLQTDPRLGVQRYEFSRPTGALVSALEDSELEVA